MSDNELSFKYKFSEDYNPKYVNGAYGGVGSRGELVINFYLERQPIPKEETYSLSGNHEIIGPISVNPSNIKSKVVRFVETGIVLNYQSAKILHEWLGKHIENLEQMSEQKKDE